MALVVESGAGLATAESYVSEADALTYLTAIGEETAWAALTTAQREAALRLATSWLDAHYVWPGSVRMGDQALAWPRVGALDCEGRTVAYDEVPSTVANATAWVAKEHGTGTIDLSGVNTKGRIKSKTSKVGELSSSIEYESGGAPSSIVELPFANSLLHCLYTSRKGNASWSVVTTVRA